MQLRCSAAIARDTASARRFRPAARKRISHGKAYKVDEAKKECTNEDGSWKESANCPDAKGTTTSFKAMTDAKASMKTTEARNDASTARRDAEYAVAKEKCATFAGDVKTNCLNDAKARFGRT